MIDFVLRTATLVTTSLCAGSLVYRIMTGDAIYAALFASAASFGALVFLAPPTKD